MSGKFEGAKFEELDPEPLYPGNYISRTGFRCSRGEFTTYLKQDRVDREVSGRVSRCWVLVYAGSIAGYITLLADRLEADSKLLAAENIEYRTFPAVKIGLLAADKRAKGAGSRLVEWAIEYMTYDLGDLLGIRFLTVDALYDVDNAYDTAPFYRKFGFLLVDPHAAFPPAIAWRTMFLDLAPLRRDDL